MQSRVQNLHRRFRIGSGKRAFSTRADLGQRASLNSATMASTTDDAAPTEAPATPNLRYIDIGINLTDIQYRGEYYGKKVHDDDLEHVIARAKDAGCQKLMITGSDLQESGQAIELAKQYPGLCYATIGVHPCSATQFDTHPEGSSAYLTSLRTLAIQYKLDGHAVAFGEIGLDYDRLHYTPKETQLKYFEAQLDLAVEIQLPLFLHMRAAAEDFERILKPKLVDLPRSGLVHSFTGTMEEMRSLVNLGLDIGVNGCSLKTEENLAVVKEVPLDRLQIETDGPWCEIRPSHASAKYLGEKDCPTLPKAVKKEKWNKRFLVKGRNEPCAIGIVAFVVARVKGISVEEVAEAAWRNSIRMFGLGESPETNGESKD